ncbi:MAG: sigma 54-interacting transcriptional regulator [Candidatus Korobacteraceae bacterium]
MLNRTTTQDENPEEGSNTDIGRMARDLNVLFKIAETINSFRDLDSLQVHLLQFIGEVIPADSGAILIIPRIDEEPSSVVTWQRDGVSQPQLNVRREVLIRSLAERSAAVADFSSASGETESVLCVPLVALQNVLGAIYLVASSGKRFPEDNVHLLTSVGGIAAVALENVLTLESLRAENCRLREELTPAGYSIVGESKPIRHLTQLVEKVAQSDCTVLIHGESGTGKELVAVAIHRHSTRSEKPFVAINCAAIPETLLESELFGYEKGAFTGAVTNKKGKLEVARDGTVFLDEIGELAPALQAKLLRALQTKAFERLGATQPIRFDARVIAATNKRLELAVKKGELRADLFYRLNVVSIPVPPLRDRREDIPLLASYFATKYAQKCTNRVVKGISPEARSMLMAYSWPGNVRELENAIQHAVVMGSTEMLLPEDLPAALLEWHGSERSRGKYQDSINRLKRNLLTEALEEANGSYPEAARLLGIHPNYLHRLARSFELDMDGRT